MANLKPPEQVQTIHGALDTMNKLMHKLSANAWRNNWKSQMKHYARRPDLFAINVLGSRWWIDQINIAKSVVKNRRVAVKAANGVGKTYLAADLVIWFLMTHPKSIVLTTAPTWRQVRNLLWEEISQKVKAAKLKMPGILTTTRLQAGPGWYALGLSSNDSVKFQGFHAGNMLIVLDEASGISDAVWEAIEGIAVGTNNKVLAIGNPLVTSGKFYRLFRDDSKWVKHTICAFDHPNVRRLGLDRPIHGCVTRDAVDAHIEEWCEHIGPAPPGAKDLSFIFDSDVGLESKDIPDVEGNDLTPPDMLRSGASRSTAVDVDVGLNDPPSDFLLQPSINTGSVYSDNLISFGREGPDAKIKEANLHPPSNFPPPPSIAEGFVSAQLSVSGQASTTPDLFISRGCLFRPNNLFRARVLGQFPTAEKDTLIPLNWIEAATKTLSPAQERKLQTGFTRLAADVARYGNNNSVIGIRTGSVMTIMETYSGCDTMQVAGQINRLAYDHQPESLMIDCIGIGSGVVDRLIELGTEGVIAVNVSLSPHNSERFANKRAELYWGLRERFRLGDIRIPADRGYQVEKLVEELSAIKYRINSMGKIQLESKDDMRSRGLSSPDHADMLAMLFDSTWDFDWNSANAQYPKELFVSEAQKMREEMANW